MWQLDILSLRNLGQIEELSNWDSGWSWAGGYYYPGHLCLVYQVKIGTFQMSEHPLSPSPFWWVMPSTFCPKVALVTWAWLNSPISHYADWDVDLPRNALSFAYFRNIKHLTCKNEKIKITAGVAGSNFLI